MIGFWKPGLPLIRLTGYANGHHELTESDQTALFCCILLFTSVISKYDYLVHFFHLAQYKSPHVLVNECLHGKYVVFPRLRMFPVSKIRTKYHFNSHLSEDITARFNLTEISFY